MLFALSQRKKTTRNGFDAYYAKAFARTTDGMALIDSDGAILNANAAFLDFYELSDADAENIIGKNWKSVILQGQSSETISAISQRLNQNGDLYGEISMQVSGRKKTAEVDLSILEDGVILAIIKSSASKGEGEKEKELLREQLFQAQKLEAIGRLAGGIAHDFNNILAAMNGYAEFLTDDLKPETPQHGFAANILKAGNQASQLVDKMLAFSRRDDNVVQAMDVKESVEETLLMLKASLPKTIDVTSYITDKPAVINGNQTQIAQTLMNLCVNAKDAMPDAHGHIKLSVDVMKKGSHKDVPRQESLPETEDLPMVSISEVPGTNNTRTRLTMGTLADKQYQYISLKVEDNGSGMSRVIMEHIFEPFFTTKPVDKGTGLGLAMVHGVVAAHQGAMVINSEPGEGTVFELLFPVIDGLAAHETVTCKDMTLETQCEAKVLIVEDQDNVRDMMGNMLQRMGVEAETCQSGLEALKILEENPDYFDIVLTDYNMPKMTGIEMIEQANKDFPDLAFIIFSGYSEEKIKTFMDEKECVKAVLRKPVPQQLIFQTINNIYNEINREKT